MSSTTLSRWSRVFVATGVVFLVAWQAAVVGDLPRRTAVALGLYGFVLHVVFGKAYSLVPSYFDRDLARPRAVVVHYPLAVAGALGLALDPLADVPDVAGTVGAVAWALGVAVFLATLGWTLRDNPLGTETGTGEHNAHRRPVDRVANAFVPVVFLYLAVGSWETLAMHAGVPALFDGYPPRATHLLAAGTAALLVFAVGFRLLPRFLVADVPDRLPPAALPAAVLPAGALGPVLIAAGLPSGTLFRVGAAFEAIAVAGFAVAYLSLYRDTDRDRVGFYGPLAGVLAGVLGVGLGMWFAHGEIDPALVVAHYRLNLLGFLGLTVVGVTYQFYPPTVGRFPGAGDRLALAAIALVVGGLLLEVAGAATDLGSDAFALVEAGEIVVLLGTLAYAYLVLGVFVQRWVR